MTGEQVARTRIADHIEDIVRAAIAMGMSDVGATAVAIRKLERLVGAPLTRHYRVVAERCYRELVKQMREGIVPLQRERAVA